MPLPALLRHLPTALLLFLLTAVAAQAQTALPAEVLAELRRAQVPPEAVAAWVEDLAPNVPPRLAWRERAPVNPASLFKLVTTAAALDLLGPAHAWSTPVWLTGPVEAGTLRGDVVIRGQGDPKLVIERVWLLLRRLRAQGVQTIGGDLVLDRSAFAPEDGSPADFDGEPLKPYNVRPGALLLNQRAVQLSLIPLPGQGVARVNLEPPLHGVQVEPPLVPLASGPCDDWRGALQLQWTDPARLRLAGRYPVACGERQWPLAVPDPDAYEGRLLLAMWQELGGSLAGRVREGSAPPTPPAFAVASPPLADVVRDINKFSNNPMAQQLFLSLALAPADAAGVVSGPPASSAAARERLRRWLALRLGDAAQDAVVDNGSGLSREQRVSALLLARLLQWAWGSAVMPEFIASLPVAGVDGTARRSRGTAGRAHLKTGSLRDVAAVAGYVLTPGGQRRLLVAVIQHPNANAARGALDALLQWSAQDGR